MTDEIATATTDSDRIDAALGLKMVSIRLPEQLVADFKILAGAGPYQALMRKCLQSYAAESLVTAGRELLKGDQAMTDAKWLPIESAPKNRTILLGKFNSLGKWRTMRGQWFSAEVIAETWEEGEDSPEGWYETSVESDDIPNCWHTEPTHWTPLPPPPENDK